MPAVRRTRGQPSSRYGESTRTGIFLRAAQCGEPNKAESVGCEMLNSKDEDSGRETEAGDVASDVGGPESAFEQVRRVKPNRHLPQANSAAEGQRNS